MSDISIYVMHSNIILPKQFFNVHFYADDTILYPQSPTQLRLWFIFHLPLMLYNDHLLIIDLF